MPAAEKQYLVSPSGQEWFASMGLDVTALQATRRGLARQCLDWTERRHHLTGPLGVELLAALCANGWLQRARETRALLVTPLGWVGLKKTLGIVESGVIAAA